MSNTPETVTLNEDQHAVALKQLEDMLFALVTLRNQLKEKPELDYQLAKAVLTTSEFKLNDFAKLTGIPTQTREEIEERYSSLRRANERVRELEGKLGEQVTAEHVSGSLKNLGKRLDAWWDQEGFGYISSAHFSKHGHLEAEFSCSLNGIFRLLDSPTPISDKKAKAQWLESLTERGFDVIEEPDCRDCALSDCDQNREALRALFNMRFPGCTVVSFENRGNYKGAHILTGVKVYVRQLQQIEALPVQLTEE